MIVLSTSVIGIYDSETLPEMAIWKESATRLERRRKSKQARKGNTEAVGREGVTMFVVGTGAYSNGHDP